MKKKYYNSTTKEWYTEGSTITKRVDNGVFSGVPSVEQLTAWGFVKWVEPAPIPYEPTEDDLKRQRMTDIKSELQSMDYLTSKYVDGEDMTEYGDWQEKRRLLRKEYNTLEQEIQCLADSVPNDDNT